MRTVVTCGSVLALLSVAIAALVAIVAPFMLPDWAYEGIYGWRYPKSHRCGDASILDKGPAEASDRYSVDLGPLPTEDERTRYRLCELPRVQLHIGITGPYTPGDPSPPWVIDVDPLADDKARLRGLTLSAELRSSAGDLMGRYSGDLADDWTWTVPHHGPSGTSSYLYGRGFSLVPSSEESYELELALGGKASDPTVESRVILTGGGWK